MTDIDLKAEIAKVQAEVLFFRWDVLPVLLNEPCEAGALSRWQRASVELADLLPLGPATANSPRLAREDFQDFLFQPATPSFSVREGRINWQIRVFIDPASWPEFFPSYRGQPDDILAVRRWLMALPVDSSVLWNALCFVLPSISDNDPRFAKFALDPETWRQIVLNDPALSEEQRTERLRLLDGYFRHVLNNALLHVLAAIANNHLPLIDEYLDHPNLHGEYTALMPHYLFAVLFEKMAALRQLAQGDWNRFRSTVV